MKKAIVCIVAFISLLIVPGFSLWETGGGEPV